MVFAIYQDVLGKFDSVVGKILVLALVAFLICTWIVVVDNTTHFFFECNTITSV